MPMPRTLRGLPRPESSSQEDINFLLTNRIPRRLATRLMGWFSRIEQPLVRDLSIGAGGCSPTSTCTRRGRTASRACTIASSASCARARARSTRTRASSSARATGSWAPAAASRARASGRPRAFPTPSPTCSATASAAARYRDGCYVTLRITRTCTTASMRRTTAAWRGLPTSPATPGTSTRSRWSASSDCSARTSARRSSRGWRGRRAGHAGGGRRGAGGEHPAQHDGAAAPAPRRECHPLRRGFTKGAEMGWFEHGSTIIVLAPEHVSLAVQPGQTIRMGERLGWL